MKLSNESTTKLLVRLEHSAVIQNWISESDSRYILFKMNEPVKDFPDFTDGLDDKLTSVALSYLSIGCSFSENDNMEQSILPLEKGATVLENIYSTIENKNDYSSYYILISSLGFYAAHQYSRSFILLKNVDVDTVISRLISCFLKRKYDELGKLLSEIFLSDEYADKTISLINDEDIANNRIYVLFLSKAFSNLLEFIYSGEDNWIRKTRQHLKDLIELLTIDAEPSLWWVVRLLKIVIDGFYENSFWKTIPPLIERKDGIIDDYIGILAFQKSPVVQLFNSQKTSLPKAINSKGAVINLPTSAGKTRISEIAILESLSSDPDSKVLYLAPFRSLAHEVEDTISNIFVPLGFEVSHLYGGTQFSKIDEILINESSVFIATPEKAKAILRSNSELKSKIKLVIIDEGHLLGPKERYIFSEMLIEELKYFINKNQGKMMLLSAVLPNADEISSWITGDKSMATSSSWRPSSQRLGLLEYTGSNVNITWKGEMNSFNLDFIQPFTVKRPRSEYVFPNNKKQAIGASALKLANSGSVLIYVGRKNMVLSQAEEVINAMKCNKEEHSWLDINEWNVFKLACEEAYGKQSNIYYYAKYGILCHHGQLTTEVRISMENLIREGKPKIIIATSTLAQGVNIGVSTVIIANVWIYKQNKISNNDFWNIAGRAGRSFVDREGRILFAVDASQGTGKSQRNKRIALDYFESNNEDAVSGLLYIVKYIYDIAEEAGVAFGVLLQMIAENVYSNIEDKHIKVLSKVFDWMIHYSH